MQLCSTPSRFCRSVSCGANVRFVCTLHVAVSTATARSSSSSSTISDWSSSSRSTISDSLFHFLSDFFPIATTSAPLRWRRGCRRCAPPRPRRRRRRCYPHSRCCRGAHEVALPGFEDEVQEKRERAVSPPNQSSLARVYPGCLMCLLLQCGPTHRPNRRT